MAKKAKAQLYMAATDGSAASDKALGFAIDRAKEAGARLLVVMAVQAGPIGAPSSSAGTNLDLMEEVRREAQGVAERGAERAKGAGVDASALVIYHEPPEDVAAALVKFAEGRRVATIFVGSHGRTGIMRVLLGSTAEKVVKLSHCPVSVVR
ncbi:MAG TPA: universal stress protein [Candidatus Thermoplasmatota archaeon]